MMETALKSVKRYPKYKDSGVEWLGEIPEDWDVLPNKHVFKLKKSQVGKKSEDYVLLSLTLKGIIKRVIEDGGKFPAEFDTYQKVEEGDFVFCLFDVEETPRCVGLSEYKGMITGAYTVMEVSKNFNEGYLYYFYLNLDSKKRMKPLYTGLRNTISKDKFFAFKTFIPPLPEQTAIANLLDDKTEKIDRAVSIKEKQIALLKERRQIIIQELVTGKKVWNEAKQAWEKPEKTIDSGVEWIGEIPEEWEVKKLFGLSVFVRGNSTFGKDDLSSEGDYVALQYGKTYKIHEIDDNFNFYVNSEFYKESQTVQYGDTILVSTSETIEDLGHSAFYRREDIGLLGGEQMLLRPKEERVDGYYLYFLSKLFTKELSKYSTGIKVFRFNINDLKTIYVSVPPIKKQVQIAKYIEKSGHKIDQAISIKKREIEKMKEYKASLVNDVVLGRVKVS